MSIWATALEALFVNFVIACAPVAPAASGASPSTCSLAATCAEEEAKKVEPELDVSFLLQRRTEAEEEQRLHNYSFADCFPKGGDHVFVEPPHLNSSQFDPLVLPCPEADGSVEDLAVLRFLQGARFPGLVGHTWGNLMATNDLSAFDAAIGAQMTYSPYPALLGECLLSFYTQIDAAKDTFKEQCKRPRPWISHPDFKPCLTMVPVFTYPSGHATFYSAMLVFLSNIFPELKERLAEVANQGVVEKVFCGIHWPSDVEAGRRLGTGSAETIMQTPQWKAFASPTNEVIVKSKEFILAHRPTAGLPVLTG